MKAIDKISMLDVTWYENQLARMGAGKEPDASMGAWRSLVGTMTAQGVQAFKMRRAKG